jgi:hypothetical protein
VSSNVFNPRKPLFWLAGAAVAAAFFASGALVARATIDDSGDSNPSDGDRAEVILPGLATGESAAPNVAASYGRDDVMTTGGRGADMSMPSCRAPLPAGVISNGNIDWAKANFAPSLPSAGFSALSFALGSQGECAKDGSATGGGLSLNTAWLHDATGIDAYVTQTASSEQIASVLRGDSATFWANGYRFDISVNAYSVMPAGATTDLPAVSPPSGAGSSSAAGGRSAPGAPTPDPRAAEVLRQLVAQLSPQTELKCFWTVGQGDWNSLAALGVGDPRGAIPSGFQQMELNVTSFNEPAAGCDTSIKPTEGFSLNAGWQKDNGAGYLGVSVYSAGYPQDFPGNINEYGANWSRGGLQFGVYAKAEKPVGIEVIRAIAKALDPQFNEACFIRERTLAEGELPALGISPAKPPSGYKLENSRMSASEIAAGCAKPDGFEPSYTANWTFTNGGDVIEAGASAYGGAPPADGGGYRGPNNLNWTSAKGVNFYVNAYSRGINPEVSEDALVAVAKSMDPSFDLSKLQEGGGEKPITLPADAPERSARP